MLELTYMNNKPFTSQEYQEIYSKVPRLCVAVVIKTEEGVVFILRQLPSWHGQWHLPGGTVLYGERVQDAVRRFARNEAGVDIAVGDLMGYIEYPSEVKEVGFGTTIALVFSSTITGGELKVNEDSSEIKIFRELPNPMIAEEKDFLKTRI
ncbi:MAG: NUDIX domain-containing protein [Patescibacteria group bacterium]